MFRASSARVVPWLLALSAACGAPEQESQTIAHPAGSGAQVPARLVGLRVGKSGDGTGSVVSSPSGIDCGADCEESFPLGSLVSLSAFPGPGGRFLGWSGACEDRGPCSVTLSGDLGVRAVFAKEHSLLVTSEGRGRGFVVSVPGGIDCGGRCSESFDPGSAVALFATAAPGSVFRGWGQDCEGSGSCAVNVDTARRVAATFDLEELPLWTVVTGAGRGSVSSVPPGIDCGVDCHAAFEAGSRVTLLATPAPGSVFSHWTGAGCGGEGSCTLSITRANAVVATFEPLTFPLTVDRTGPGTVRSSPAGIDCGGTCAGRFVGGTSVVLHPEARPGAAFVGWGGACMGTGPCVLTVSSPGRVTAHFALEPQHLFVAHAGAGVGTVASDPPGIDCGADCSQTLLPGSTVVLTARPQQGSEFLGWAGAGCRGTGPCELTVSTVSAVAAIFSPPRTLLTVRRGGSGQGAVHSLTPGIACGADCSETLRVGRAVVLFATAAPGSSFSGWSGGGCQGRGPCILVVEAATVVTARFEAKELPSGW